MKPFHRLKSLVPTVAVAIFAAALGGCTCPSSGGGADDPCKHAMYGGTTAMEPYTDAALKFRLCLPKGLTKQAPAGRAAGSVEFTGFAVPAGTNLESKTLVIVAGSYDEMQGAKAFGQFTAGGVTFRRVKADEGSAGHSTLHIIYTWKMDGKPVHFDFTHRAVNPGVFDPGKRPAVYDQAAQVKLTEEIMGTFTRL